MIAAGDLQALGWLCAVWLVLASSVIVLVLRMQPPRVRGRHCTAPVKTNDADAPTQRLQRLLDLDRPAAPRPVDVTLELDAVPPMTVTGPPGARGVLPVQGLPVRRIYDCSRCHDLGFVAGCMWCGREPALTRRSRSMAQRVNGGRS